MVASIEKEFQERFGRKPLVIAAPGRVNLIGEHTDYNKGFVLPGAVDKRIYVAIAKNDSSEVTVFARQFAQSISFPVSAKEPMEGWINYLIGVTYYLQQTGTPITGVDVLIDGDIPVGAGMSSSAALCSGYGFALNELFGLDFSRMELAVIGQQTEHNFAGVKCGIMDQFASLHGKKNHVMKLDCRSMEFEYIPFDFPGYKIVLVNTMVSHSLAGSEYNVRRAQCEEGVALLKKYYPEIQSLRDVSYEQLTRHWQEFNAVVYDRCTYIVNENQRLLAGCDALRNNDLPGFGEMMYASHKGLSKRYGVSCKELDYLVDIAKTAPGIAGARMMGGGFGGCTINIVEEKSIDSFVDFMQESYKLHFSVIPEVYVMQLEDGVKEVVSGK
ncbi:MAG: galactokinase [Chitinophagaceae bacterium]|nr:galactokinase [Chitinophagaceae bacterium]